MMKMKLMARTVKMLNLQTLLKSRLEVVGLNF